MIVSVSLVSDYLFLQPSTCRVQAEFDQFNDSDLLLAEVVMDLESSITTDNNTATSNKRIRSEDICKQSNCNGAVKNIEQSTQSVTSSVKHKNQSQQSVTYTHRNESQHHTSSQKENCCSSDIEDVFFLTDSSYDDLFDDNIQPLNENSDNPVENISHVKHDKTKDDSDVSLSEYFFLDNKQDKSVGHMSCDGLTPDIKPAVSCSDSEAKSTKSLVVNTPSMLVDSVHSDFNMSSSNSRHLEIGAKLLETPPTAGKSVVVGSSSIKDKMKRRLQGNIGSVTVQRNLEESVRKEAIRLAKLDASQIRKEGSEVDIGPFYGLPAKVQQLFETHRGVTKLYGEFIKNNHLAFE